MALIYPEYPCPLEPLNIENLYDIIKSDISFGVVYKRKKSLRKKRVFTLNYGYLTKQELSILQNFYYEVQDTDLEFIFTMPTKLEFKREYIGKVADTTQEITFELPFKEIDYLKIYKNGVEITKGFEIINNHNERDIIHFYGNIETGDLITCDFKGKLCVWCEFDENSLGVELLSGGYSNISDLRLIEVLK